MCTTDYSVHAVDWLTGGEENASLLLLELLASVIDNCVINPRRACAQRGLL